LIHSLIRLGVAIREETRMNIRYHVELSEAERCELAALVGGGKHYARKIKRAQILLAADSGLSDDDIAAAVAVGGSTVYRTKRRFVEGNLEAALNEEPRAGADRKLTSNEEALFIATACSNPPEGRARWTLELLAGAMIKLTDHDSLSRETVRRRLAENHLKPWQKDMWCIPRSTPSTSPAWRTCSTSMPSSQIPAGSSWKLPPSASAIAKAIWSVMFMARTVLSQNLPFAAVVVAPYLAYGLISLAKTSERGAIQ
jgi:transposase